MRALCISAAWIFFFFFLPVVFFLTPYSSLCPLACIEHELISAGSLAIRTPADNFSGVAVAIGSGAGCNSTPMCATCSRVTTAVGVVYATCASRVTAQIKVAVAWGLQDRNLACFSSAGDSRATHLDSRRGLYAILMTPRVKVREGGGMHRHLVNPAMGTLGLSRTPIARLAHARFTLASSRPVIASFLADLTFHGCDFSLFANLCAHCVPAPRRTVPRSLLATCSRLRLLLLYNSTLIHSQSFITF